MILLLLLFPIADSMPVLSVCDLLRSPLGGVLVDSSTKAQTLLGVAVFTEPTCLCLFCGNFPPRAAVTTHTDPVVVVVVVCVSPHIVFVCGVCVSTHRVCVCVSVRCVSLPTHRVVCVFVCVCGVGLCLPDLVVVLREQGV